jgi:hypothetical protein
VAVGDFARNARDSASQEEGSPYSYFILTAYIISSSFARARVIASKQAK